MDPSVGGRSAPRAVALPDDQILVDGLRARDERVFTMIVDAWTPTMTRIARAHVPSADAAADVVQETWLGVLRGIHRFEGRSALRTWVFRILTNTAKTYGVRESRAVPWSSLAGPESDGPTVEPERFRDGNDRYPGHWQSFPEQWPSPEGGAVGAEVRKVVGGAVEELPDRQRMVITLRDIEGFGSEEVCDLLGVTAANQRVLLHRARAAVRSRLEVYFGVAARWGATP